MVELEDRHVRREAQAERTAIHPRPEEHDLPGRAVSSSALSSSALSSGAGGGPGHEAIVEKAGADGNGRARWFACLQYLHDPGPLRPGQGLRKRVLDEAVWSRGLLGALGGRPKRS